MTSIPSTALSPVQALNQFRAISDRISIVWGNTMDAIHTHPSNQYDEHVHDYHDHLLKQRDALAKQIPYTHLKALVSSLPRHDLTAREMLKLSNPEKYAEDWNRWESQFSPNILTAPVDFLGRPTQKIERAVA